MQLKGSMLWQNSQANVLYSQGNTYILISEYICDFNKMVNHFVLGLPQAKGLGYTIINRSFD